MHAKLLQSCLTLFDPKDYTHQTPLSMGFPRQEYWRGLPFPTPGDLPDHGSNLCLLRLLQWQADSLPLLYLGSPLKGLHYYYRKFGKPEMSFKENNKSLAIASQRNKLMCFLSQFCLLIFHMLSIFS